MKRVAALGLLLLGAFATTSALAGHYYHGGYYGGYHGGYHGGVHFGLFLGAPVFGPWWWYSAPPPVYYDPPVIYRRSVTVAPPPTVIESAPVYSAPSTSANNGVIELGPVDRATEPRPQQQQQQSAPHANMAQPSPSTPGQTALQTPRQVYVYPRQGQSAQQQAQDEAECNRWASSQMGSGFDATQAVANFQRALGACLDAHGYSVR